jgi:hypothetical protein
MAFRSSRRAAANCVLVPTRGVGRREGDPGVLYLRQVIGCRSTYVKGFRAPCTALRLPRSRSTGRRTIAVAVVVAMFVLLVAACGPANEMQIYNRTPVPLLVVAGKSTIVVDACSERILNMSGGAWGGDNAGRGLVEQAPPRRCGHSTDRGWVGSPSDHHPGLHRLGVGNVHLPDRRGQLPARPGCGGLCWLPAATTISVDAALDRTVWVTRSITRGNDAQPSSAGSRGSSRSAMPRSGIVSQSGRALSS